MPAQQTPILGNQQTFRVQECAVNNPGERSSDFGRVSGAKHRVERRRLLNTPDPNERFATRAVEAENPAGHGVIEAWRVDYNTVRPHGRLGKLPPAVFAASALAMQRDGGAALN